jgi:two-component system, OmpR family, response regulator
MIPRKKVLLIQDNILSTDIMGQSLEVSGFDTRVVYEAVSALRSAKQFSPDAIIFDMAVPDVGGLVLARVLREASGLDKQCVFFLADSENQRFRQMAAMEGFNNYLLKPINFSELRNLINVSL